MARDRVVELRRVRAGDLRPDPRNWRRHPPGQRAALSRMLDRLGYVDAVIARETPDGLVLVDGHLRAGMSPDAQIPVLVVDLDHSEAGEVLATALLHNSGRVTDRSQSCLNAIEFALTQACPGLTYDSVPHI